MLKHLSSKTKADILIIDDTPENLRLLNQILSKDYKVRLAPSGEKGLDAARSTPPDLVLLDVMMPSLNGYDVAAKLKAEAATSEIPIIFISALNDTESKVRGFEVGGVDYITKPFQEQEVLARVKTHLSLHALTQELQTELAERKRAEEALRESEKRFRALFEQAAVGVALLETKTGRYARVNQKYCDFLGYSVEELLQRTFQDVTLPEDVAANANHNLLLMEGRISEFSLEKRYVRKDGRVVWGNLTVSPLWKSGETADINYHIAVVEDITERKRAEEALRQREHDFSTLVENATDMIVRFDTNLRHIYCNPAVERQFGAPASFFLGKTFLDIGANSEQSRLSYQSLQHVRDTGLEQELESSFLTPGGMRYFQTRIMPERAPDGRIESLLAITRDVTGHKRAENIIQARLRISEYAANHMLGELLQNALDELCAIADSPIGFFHFVEPDQITISLQAWSTRTLEEMCTAEGKGQHYNLDQAGVWVDCVREGRPVIHNDYVSLPYRKGLPEGHAPIVREMVFPILRNREIVAIIGVGNKAQDYTEEDVAYASRLADMIWDITERKHAEEALQESEERYRLITQNAEDIIWTVDMDLRPTYVSPSFEQALGYSAAEVMKLPPEQLLTPASFEAGQQAFAQELALASPQPDPNYARVLEMEYCRKDGSAFWVEMKFSFFRNEAGQPTGVLGVGRDVTERKRMEEALRASEERFRTIYDTEPECVKILNPDCTLVTMNPAGLAMIEVEAMEMVKGQSVLSFVDEEYREAFKTLTEKVCTLGESGQLTFKVTGRKGTSRWLEMHSVPLRNASGEITELLGVTRDISARKQVEIALQESETKLGAIVTHSNDGILAHKDGRIVFANPALAKMVGIENADELVGTSVIDLVTPESREIVVKNMQHRVRGEPAPSSYEAMVQFRGIEPFPVELNVSTYRLNDELYILAMVRDITERKKMEQSLLQRNREMATLYETSLEINALSDLGELLTTIVQRACALLEIPFGALWLMRAEEELLELVVGHHVPAHWIGNKIRPGEGLAGQVVQVRNPVIIEDYRSWDAKVEAFNDTPARRALAVPLKVRDDVIGVIVLFDQQVGTFADEEVRLASLFAEQAAVAVTNAQFAAHLEKRVAERTTELALALKELESISYTVSHDLRTPLRAIIGYSRMIQDEQAGGVTPEGIRMLGLIRENAQVMGKMVDGLLDFMQLNRKTLIIKTISPGQLIRQALKELGPEQDGRQVEIKIQDMPPSRGDGELLFSVWHNLLSNALKFTRPRACAYIEAGCMSGEDGQPVYYVKDNGVGFNMRYANKLFKVFHRLHHSHEFEGIGMGLALAQRVVLRHGGRIWVEAQEGQGATFFFTLGSDAKTPA